MNSDVYDLGEINIFEESYKQAICQESYRYLFEKDKRTNISITNKWLYNYQYNYYLEANSGAKIIHCYRNPLDNILSILEQILKAETNILLH